MTEPRQLTDHFKDHAPSAHPQKWDELWADNFTPWDRGFPSPALVDLLASRSSSHSPSSPRKKALVPGCGKGYDVLLLSSYGYDTYGLDFSPIALEAARKVQGEMDGKGVYETKEGCEKGAITWVSGDWFGDEWLMAVEGQKVFDLIYDYTFLSALPPDLRPAWAKRHGELLAPDGNLVCLEWPTHKPVASGGPPWSLPSKVYLAHLARPGKVLPYGDDGELLEAECGEPTNDGLKRTEHFQPNKTHEAGYVNGEMVDWISIWDKTS